jgi:hypothetical protein
MDNTILPASLAASGKNAKKWKVLYMHIGATTQKWNYIKDFHDY